MRHEILVVFDNKAGYYWPPVVVRTIAQGVRSFANSANSLDSDVGKNPDDFSLFHIGSFDDHTGLVEAVSPHRNLGLASTFINDVPVRGSK